MKKRKPKKIIKPKLDTRYWVVRKEYWDIMHDASQSFDKLIIGISSAAIGFAFALIHYKQIINFICVGILAGILFVLAIILSLLSLWFRQDYGFKAIRHLNKEYKNETSEPFEDNVIKQMELTQAISGILFVIALILLMIFISLNLNINQQA